jgi:High-affinity nickel-transport protein
MVEALLALALGFKHGLDPDHLALIDGLVRIIRQHSPRTARFAGLLFSLGHSLAICMFTMAAVLLSRFIEIKVPAWLEISGVVLSAGALIFLALMNLASLKNPDAARPVHLLSSQAGNQLKGRDAAWSVLVLGAVFAFSFDTVTQAALFAGLAHGAQIEPGSALMKGLLLSSVFGFGMICADTVNGIFVNKLLDQLSSPKPLGLQTEAKAKADLRRIQGKDRAMDFMTVSLAILSLLIACLALGKLLLREAKFSNLFDEFFRILQGQELMLGLGAIAWVLLSYFIAASIAFHASRAASTN